MRTLASALFFAITLLWGSAGYSQDWARAMFIDGTTHDFGVVARGAKVEHRFVVENCYEEDVHIRSLSSTCGCSTPKASKNTLKTWEKAEILVTLDTRGFLGRKDATITVRFEFDGPYSTAPAEVQLHVYSYIRSDVVVQPGAIQFGSIPQGAEAKQQATISYAGRADWRIERVECNNPNIEASLTETLRESNRVGYNLSVRLKETAPVGYFRDQLILVTNDYDARASQVPVTAEGRVISALEVRPSPLSMGTIEAGQSVERKLVIQGRSPFRITAVHCADERFQCKPTDESKTVHILPVTFTAKDFKPSETVVKSKLRIQTDLSGAGAVEVEASVQIKPSGAAKP